jgi:hypothetical protein
MAYGNMHHVEIIQDKKTEKYQGVFVTMMEASHRAKGIKSHLNPSGWKQSIVRTDHGEEYNFTMALHINDLVSVLKNESEREFYRIQVLDRDGGRLELRLNTASTLGNKSEGLRKSISSLMALSMKKHGINAIGCLI